MKVHTAAAERILDTYRQRTKRSQELFIRAGHVLEGGTTRTSVFFSPYPCYISEGQGCRITDVDGNVRIDFLNNYTSLIHGHAYPPIVEAVTRQIQKGSAYGAPTELEVQLAALIQQRVPSIERLRFTTSGGEAVMFALRVARAFTGRRKIAKFEGGFHGSHELAQVSVAPSLEKAGPSETPNSLADAAGIPPDWATDVVMLPFNNLPAVERILDRHPGTLAALIAEPILGSAGVIAPRPGFLQGLRDLTAKRGILLVFDEIISLRVALGGAQELYGVRPDLTTLGKIISGGMPIAAFGGREDIMALFDPRQGPPAIPQSGTFNAAAVCCAAGVAGYGAITPAGLVHIDRLAEDLWTRANALFRRLHVPAQMVGIGSLFNIHCTEEPIVDYRAVLRGDRKTLTLLALALMNRGIFLAPRGMGCISSVMTPAEIDAFLAALEGALVEDLEVTR
ncbi:MAG: aspartate aminotransferase family protein [candidate division NC10 bacterium]